MTDDERPEGHDTVVSKGECEKCGSLKGFVTYADGHAHCFSQGCGHYIKASGQSPSLPSKPSPAGSLDANLLAPDAGSWPNDGLQTRRIEAATMRKYGVFLGSYSGGRRQVYPYTDSKGEVVAQKLRFPDKSFVVLKGEGYEKIEKCQLFGQSVYGDRFDRQVVITEGELDALSVAQALDFKAAVVSVNAGAGSAYKCLQQNYLWLDRFEDIVLWFDDDEPGREAAQQCASLFKVGKVRLAKAVGFKDASDVLQADKPGDIKQALYGAAKWRPRGIVNAADRPEDVDAPEEDTLSYSFPPMMPLLQEMTGGIFPGDVLYLVAGTGVGKSALLREIEYDLALKQDCKLGIMSFEDTVRDAKMGLMSIHVSERLGLIKFPEAAGRAAYNGRMRKVHSEVFSGGNIELFDPETAEWKLEAILGYCRYMAKALGCKGIVIDPLSFVAAGIDLSADERRVLDAVAAEFARLGKELGIFFIIAHHLRRTQGIPHEEGAPTSLNELRSSGGMANYATGVIGAERNNQAAGDSWRVTQLRIIKPIRRTGRSGLADVLYYGEDGRLVKSHLPFPPMGKPTGEDEQSTSRGFSPVGNDY